MNSQSNPLFTISGGRLLNAQVTSGDYNGNYLCLDGDGESAGIEFNVRINGTSNLSAGAIVGIVFAILFAIVIIVVGLYLAKQKGFLGGDENQYSWFGKNNVFCVISVFCAIFGDFLRFFAIFCEFCDIFGFSGGFFGVLLGFLVSLDFHEVLTLLRVLQNSIFFLKPTVHDEDEKLHGNDVEVDDYDRNSHAGRFRSAGQTSQLT